VRRAPVRHPRRISGPARPARTTRPARAAPAARPASRTAGARTAAPPRGLALHAIDRYARLADSSLLDRLVRGRLWIGLLAFALIGIVAMQLMVLKLNAGIGATLTRAAELQRANAQLGIEAATADGEGRVEPLAAAQGMTFAAPGSVHFVTASPAYVGRAAAALAQPIQPRESPAPQAEPAASQATAGESAGSESTASEATGGEASSGEASTSAPTAAASGGEQTEAGSG
jgi:hypothetical protein